MDIDRSAHQTASSFHDGWIGSCFIRVGSGSEILFPLQAMSYESVQFPENSDGVGVYECEVNLKFRMIEEQDVLQDRDQLLGVLLEAFGYGADEYLEATHVHAEARKLPETDASPELRRQLIRLRNSREFQ